MIIGTKAEVEKYATSLEKSAFYQKIIRKVVEDGSSLCFEDGAIEKADAIVIAGRLTGFSHWTRQFIRMQKAVYFVHQPNLSPNELTEIEKTTEEANGILYHETLILNHPLFTDFLTRQQGQLTLTLKRSVPSKANFISAISDMLYFISSFSTMPIKRMNFQSSFLKEYNSHGIQTEFQLYDHSICNVEVWISKEPSYMLQVTSSSGSFLFDVENAELQNSHGICFPSERQTEEELLSKSLNDFAQCIVFQKKPTFSFSQYQLIHNVLNKINQFLKDNF
jgi:hypothetical protein